MTYEICAEQGFVLFAARLKYPLCWLALCQRVRSGGKYPEQNPGAPMLKSTQLRPGMIIMHEGDRKSVV